MNRVLKVIIYLSIVTTVLFSSEKQTITWLVNDAPPFYIQKGYLKEGGFGDLTQKMIINELSQYNHKIRKTSLKRAMKDFKYKKEVCFSTWIYNSTPDLVITSIPNIYYPPLGVITTIENKKRINMEIIDIDKLLSNKSLVFGKAKGRGYSEPLESIVNKYKNQSNFKIRTSSIDSTNGIFEMIKRERIDYTIDYFSSLTYYEIYNKDHKKLVFLPIKQNLDEGTLGAVACSKSSWGKKVIKDINESIKKVRSNFEYKQILSEWLVPIDNKQKYWTNYEKKIENIK